MCANYIAHGTSNVKTGLMRLYAFNNMLSVKVTRTINTQSTWSHTEKGTVSRITASLASGFANTANTARSTSGILSLDLPFTNPCKTLPDYPRFNSFAFKAFIDGFVSSADM